jgi:methylmalonic aciduria homocystinuria type C protein
VSAAADPPPAPDAPDAPGPLAVLAARARVAGFDLAASLALDARDAPLPTFGRARTLAVVIGNTRALWPRFIAAFAADPALANDPDPLDRYTERSLAPLAPAPAAIYFAHRRYVAPGGADGWVPIQRLAERAGLAVVAPSGLAVHPIFGPWIALRALVVLDAAPPPPAAAPPVRKPCDCEHGCAPARAVLARAGDPFDPSSETWRMWAAVRLACPAGREHQYPADQLRYHYTRDLSLLRRAAGLGGSITPPAPSAE